MTAERQYPGVLVEEVPSGIRAIAGATTSVTAFVGEAGRGPIYEPARVTSYSEFSRLFGGFSHAGTMGYSVQHFFQNGGSEAIIVRASDGHAGTIDGVRALESVESFDLLCLPPPALDAEIGVETWSEAASYCRQRRAVLIVDAPATWVTRVRRSTDRIVAAVEDLRDGIGADSLTNVAAYFPRILAPDPERGGQVGEFAPSGAVAGVIARTDARRGVWKAPAGLEAGLQGVAGLSYSLIDAENGVLNSLGLNCLRDMPGSGPVVWGARTLAGADHSASEWKYLPIRRLALYVSESLYRGLAWVVLEVNGEPLWARIRKSVEAFMHGLFAQGAFQGTTPTAAYLVQCDAETTTHEMSRTES